MKAPSGAFKRTAELGWWGVKPRPPHRPRPIGGGKRPGLLQPLSVVFAKAPVSAGGRVPPLPGTRSPPRLALRAGRHRDTHRGGCPLPPPGVSPSPVPSGLLQGQLQRGRGWPRCVPRRWGAAGGTRPGGHPALAELRPQQRSQGARDAAPSGVSVPKSGTGTRGRARAVPGAALPGGLSLRRTAVLEQTLLPPKRCWFSAFPPLSGGWQRWGPGVACPAVTPWGGDSTAGDTTVTASPRKGFAGLGGRRGLSLTPLRAGAPLSPPACGARGWLWRQAGGRAAPPPPATQGLRRGDPGRAGPPGQRPAVTPALSELQLSGDAQMRPGGPAGRGLPGGSGAEGPHPGFPTGSVVPLIPELPSTGLRPGGSPYTPNRAGEGCTCSAALPTTGCPGTLRRPPPSPGSRGCSARCPPRRSGGFFCGGWWWDGLGVLPLAGTDRPRRSAARRRGTGRR